MNMPDMPEVFKGKCTARELTCGICERRHGFWAGRSVEENRKLAREMGWVYRPDLGWICPCRHQCENLDLGGGFRIKKRRPHSRRKKLDRD